MNVIRNSLFTTTKLLTLTACLLAPMACDDANDADETQEGYLFGLRDSDVVQIHEAYLDDEPLELTMARLSAPFDCSLFDDLCEQVGVDAAERITGQLVDLALEGDAAEDIDAELSVWLEEAMDARVDENADANAWTHRSSSSWVYSTAQNGRRVGVRKGITTPVIGQRRAWTEARFVHSSSFNTRVADVICANPGRNTQIHTTFTSASGPVNTTIESLDPSETCRTNSRTARAETRHARRSGGEGNGIQWWYTLNSRGTARAFDGGRNYTATGVDHSRTYW